METLDTNNIDFFSGIISWFVDFVETNLESPFFLMISIFAIVLVVVGIGFIIIAMAKRR